MCVIKKGTGWVSTEITRESFACPVMLCSGELRLTERRKWKILCKTMVNAC